MPLTALYVRTTGLIGAEVDDDLILLNANRGEYFGISGIGKRMWGMLEKPVTIGQLVDEITSEYDVDVGICRDDTETFISQMLGAGLVEEKQEEGS